MSLQVNIVDDGFIEDNFKDLEEAFFAFQLPEEEPENDEDDEDEYSDPDDKTDENDGSRTNVTLESPAGSNKISKKVNNLIDAIFASISIV